MKFKELFRHLDQWYTILSAGFLLLSTHDALPQGFICSGLVLRSLHVYWTKDVCVICPQRKTALRTAKWDKELDLLLKEADHLCKLVSRKSSAFTACGKAAATLVKITGSADEVTMFHVSRIELLRLALALTYQRNVSNTFQLNLFFHAEKL